MHNIKLESHNLKKQKEVKSQTRKVSQVKKKPMASKRKYNELNFEQKLSLISDSEDKLMSQRQLASKYEISKSQVHRIIANKEKIKSDNKTRSKSFLKRSRMNRKSVNT